MMPLSKQPAQTKTDINERLWRDNYLYIILKNRTDSKMGPLSVSPMGGPISEFPLYYVYRLSFIVNLLYSLTSHV